MSLKKTVAATVIAAVAAFGFAGFGTAEAKDKLRIATEGAFPPFNFVDASGKAQGFDVDIANALCAEMQADCEIVTQDWDGIIPGLLAKKYDAIVASLSITEERKQSVAFTEPYYSNKLRFVGPAGQAADISAAGLKGKAIGVQRATISAEWLEKNAPGAEIKMYGSNEEAYLDLTAGRLDLMLNDAYVSYDWLKSDAGKGFAFKGDPVFDGDKIGIAVRKDDAALQGKFNAALAAILKNGTYEKLNAKYFPFSIY